MSIICADKKFERFEDVTPDILRGANVGLLLCDLDNTLKTRNDKEPEEALRYWVSSCKKAGITIVVISNNGKKKKIQRFCEPINVPCTWWAKKPISTKLTAAMKEYGFKSNQTVMLGDKWSTDVLAAKFAGVRAWKVKHRKEIIKDEKKCKK